MKTLKKWTHISVLQVIIPALLIAALAMGPVGCGADQIIAGLDAAAQVATAAGPIIAAVSPEYGGIVIAVGKTLTDLSGLYTQYDKAAATEKPGIAGQIHALTSTALANLQTIFNDAHVKNSQVVVEVTAFVAVANTAIQVLLSKLPPAPTSQASVTSATTSQSLPVVQGAKSASDLKKYWNGQIGAAHPDAMVK